MSSLKTTAHPTMHSASRHKNGRVFGRYHNDRQGEMDYDECHVVPALTKNNLYYNIEEGWYSADDGQQHRRFIDVEDDYIKERLRGQWEAQMEKYRAKSQYGRIKSLDDWYEDGRKSGSITVEQQYICVGNYNDGCLDATELKDVIVDYIEESEKYNKMMGVECVTLTIAINADEEVNGVVTTHAHQNRIFFWHDDDGITRHGQTQALNRSRIEPPDPTREISSHNNCKMTFTAAHREIYLDVCEQHGIEIDRTPLPGGNTRHAELDMFITQQNRKKKQQNKELEEENENLREANDAKARELAELQQQMQQMQARIDALTDAARGALSDDEQTVFEFGKAQSRAHGDEWQQFLDDKFDTPAPEAHVDEFSL